MAPSTYQLCVTCHGATGSGANTDVLDGVYLNRRVPAASQGTYGRGLLGGGFANTLMNTANTATPPGSRPATSSHVTDGATLATVWGFGSNNSTTVYPGPTGITLDCANCHSPHGKAGSTGQATYRMLRSKPIIGTQTYSAIANVTDPATKIYTVSSATNVYLGPYAGNKGIGVGNYGPSGLDLRDQLTTWCRQCHTRYWSNQNFSTTTDKFLTKLHLTSPGTRSCINCHVAHGSSAVVTSYTLRRAHIGGAGTSPPDSALTRGDVDRQCQFCHSMEGAP